ncbi:multidrug ABC transporter ATP-binding protein [Rhodococcoides trifolii]|uniref:Multidrug ABC transporter ATP-binding protein n=1 Tax=Rhodococcoides trifolii TaxID=908250 RepID=A0A917LGE9_9NOCA|nr:ABC transporter ATP-binding protein [Rhodococcus trifolii]GGG20951.1 multidrug ABC transporter ATP-binding protein [Rhodococcus trifolii]
MTTTSHAPVVQLSNVSKKYDDYLAVDDVSFTVRSGTVLALLGTNGAGKTTTIDIATGMMHPTAGSVRLFGEDPHTDRAQVADRIGIMLQDAGFFDGLTVGETIDAWRRFTPRARHRDEAVEMVSLHRQLGTTVGRLSGGERRRLDLALALLGTPDLLFLDEPTTGLDPAARHQTWELLSAMVDDGLTVVLTTHYMEEAERLADEIAIIDNGRIVRLGPLADFTTGCSTRIDLSLRCADDAQRLALAAGSNATVDGGRISLTTADPQPALLDLLRWAQSAGLEFESIRVGASTLEQSFLDTITEVAR